MLKSKYLLSLYVLLATGAQAKSTYITPKLIKEQFATNPPDVKRIQANLLQSKVNNSKFEENFDYTITGSGSYFSSEQKTLLASSPTTSPIKTLNAGITKNLKSGFTLSANSFTSQSTVEGFLDKGTVSGIGATVAMDLSKNFLGAISSKTSSNLKLQEKQSIIQSRLALTTFKTNVMKIYWALVANNEALKISNNLYQTSLKQTRAAKKRYRNKIADRGEVARYESQVAARSSNIIALKYERERLIQNLKELLPGLSDKRLRLGSYNMDYAVNSVLSCTQTIAKKNHTPFEYTQYDEILALLKEIQGNQRDIDNRHAKADVSMSATAEKVGTAAGGFSNSLDDFSDGPQSRYTVGFNVNIPLGSTKTTTQQYQKKMHAKRLIAEQEAIVGKLNAYHTQVVREIDLLKKVVQSQKENAQKLALSLKSSKRKYRQARITVRELVNDQDSYLQSLLNEVQTKYQVIVTLLEYLSVFNQTPCELNVSSK